MTAYWLNHKKKWAVDGKYCYFYPYTRCEIDDTPTFFIDGKQYVLIEVSEAEYMALRELDDEEYNDERSVHNKRWTADIPRLADEGGDAVDFWTDRAEDKRTHDIEGDICEEMDRRAAVRSLPPMERRRMTYDFYLDEVLSRKYELRRIRRICTFAKRIAAKTRKKEVRLAMRREIAQMTEERFQIQQELKGVIEVHRASLPPEVAAKIYRKTSWIITKKTDKS